MLIAGLLLPGAGYVMLGRTGRGAFFLVAIVGTFVAGMAIGSFRCVFLEGDWFIVLAQMLAGVPAFILAAGSSFAGVHDYPRSYVIPLFDVGILYTCVAGLMNMQVALDAALKADHATEASKETQEDAPAATPARIERSR